MLKMSPGYVFTWYWYTKHGFGTLVFELFPGAIKKVLTKKTDPYYCLFYSIKSYQQFFLGLSLAIAPCQGPSPVNLRDTSVETRRSHRQLPVLLQWWNNNKYYYYSMAPGRGLSPTIAQKRIVDSFSCCKITNNKGQNYFKQIFW